MELKLLVLAGLFQIILSAPDPDPNPDTFIDVRQEVDAGGSGCCPGSCCPKPKGCTWGGEVYQSGTELDTDSWDNCAKIKCKDGKWETNENNCFGKECNCMPVCGIDDDTNTDEVGCILGEPNLPWMACNCTLLELDVWPPVPPKCSGTIVENMACPSPLFSPPASYVAPLYCRQTGTGLGFCLQGGGNCNGYSVDSPRVCPWNI